jgi:hypothetical protein
MKPQLIGGFVYAKVIRDHQNWKLLRLQQVKPSINLILNHLQFQVFLDFLSFPAQPQALNGPPPGPRASPGD